MVASVCLCGVLQESAQGQRVDLCECVNACVFVMGDEDDEKEGGNESSWNRDARQSEKPKGETKLWSERRFRLLSRFFFQCS